MQGYLESWFCVDYASSVQQSLTVFWREELSKIIETIIFEIPILITMGFAVYKYLPGLNFQNYSGKNTQEQKRVNFKSFLSRRDTPFTTFSPVTPDKTIGKMPYYCNRVFEKSIYDRKCINYSFATQYIHIRNPKTGF